ncbi:hypothetical protein SAMN05444128_1384 [Pontibacter indicus]|uniref:Uncharacterized protein n=1 Tax=Pontibacter indicus TaxID=1317125 RepID=A0A1R3X295_9BACT|nr:hypothetical protein SAMN05444128_1384 [Pontibacter indicus]
MLISKERNQAATIVHRAYFNALPIDLSLHQAVQQVYLLVSWN